MTDDEQISTYLRRVRSSLQFPRGQRQRVLEEIESHLHDGAAEHMRSGATRADAVAHVIEELGPPEAVGTAFIDGRLAPKSTGPLRWLPLLLPLALLAETIGLLLWRSITWIPGGWTVGERTVLWQHVRVGLIAGLLSYAAGLSIRHADRDRTWRWAAWACSACVVVYLALGW